MGKFIITLTTTVVLLGLIARSIRNNRKIKNSISLLLNDINRTYKELFTERSLIIRLTQGGMVVFAEFSALISIFTAITKYSDTHFSFSIYWVARILAFIISFILVHYSIGYVLLISSKIHKFIYKVDDKNLKVDFILSYFITSTFLTVLVLFPSEFQSNAIFGLIGVVISYYLNFKVLLTLMINPHNVKSKTDSENKFARVMIAAILILVMIVLNLYLAVCFTNGLGNGAYSNASGNFDLFYYTIITFTTIGYGDIVPITMLAKILAIVISITSVICLTVFLSSVLSNKDKI